MGPTRRRSCSPRSGAWWTQGGVQGGREPRCSSRSVLWRPGGGMGAEAGPGLSAGRRSGLGGWEHSREGRDSHTMAWTGATFDKGALRSRGVWPPSQGHTVAGGRAKPWSRALTAGLMTAPPWALVCTSCAHATTPGSPHGFLGTSFLLHNLLTIPLQPTSALHS